MTKADIGKIIYEKMGYIKRICGECKPAIPNHERDLGRLKFRILEFHNPGEGIAKGPKPQDC
jgi:hypothetical protein